MKTHAFLVGLGLLAASVAPTLADSVTASVNNWDAADRTLTLSDKSQFMNIAKEVAVPDLRAGDQVTIDYQATEDGVQAIDAISATRDIARQQTPATPKRG